MSEVRRIIIEEVVPSRLEVPGQKQSEGGWRISPETAAAIPEAEFSAVILTIAGVVQQNLLRENARLRGTVAILHESPNIGMSIPLPNVLKHSA